ncbi:unnamed protein product [Arctia plantaginis]|uniref:CUT domain-containing protein n=1 Tax=Arctia plantaginis TaxID=874455 RepID=A0A8S1A389_ARCPL|nr:unnamed protein product [Arctia plantaginis]
MSEIIIKVFIKDNKLEICTDKENVFMTLDKNDSYIDSAAGRGARGEGRVRRAGVFQSPARPRSRRPRAMDEVRARDRAPLTVIVAPSNVSPSRLSPADLLPDGDAAFHPLSAVNGRLTPPGLEPASYATLTPLLPLPPISTVSDKFAYHAGGTFTVIQQQQSYASLSPAAYNEPLSPQSAYSRRSASPGSFERRSPTPPLPSPGLDLNAALLAREEQQAAQQSHHDSEEINTKELAQRISGELKRYSIPQAIFAQRVLCRSQGTLSDLLRNPKPWSKLKSGRETFRRMWKWLQEPEFQRMSALRLADTPNQHQTIKGDNVNNMPQQPYCQPRDYQSAPPAPPSSSMYPGPTPSWDAPYEPAGDVSCL